LYSADVSPLAAAPLIAEQRSIDSAGEFVSRSSVETSAPVAAHASHELVFLDSDVPSYAQLIDDIRTQATDQRKIEVFLLDGNTNGIKQISAVLASQTDINAIHLISHGADGQLKLGATTLNFDSLLGNAAKIKAWGPSLGEGADLLVYGCNVAQHPDGKALIDALSRLTGANVAASDDLTGSVTLGGDWTLEYETGRSIRHSQYRTRIRRVGHTRSPGRSQTQLRMAQIAPSRRSRTIHTLSRAQISGLPILAIPRRTR
jgi:hypothetical protein